MGDGADGGVPVEPRTASLLDILRVGTVMLDDDGRILLWSPTTEEILGWEAGQTMGRPITEFLAPGEDVAIRHELRHALRWRGILHVHHRQGHVVEVEGRASVLTDTESHPFVLADIVETSRIRAVEHDLAALDALFVSSPLGIAFFDTDKRYVRVNEALARLHGGPADSYPGKSVHEVLPPAMAAEVAAVQASVLKTGRPVVDRLVRAPDGVGARSVSYSRLADHDGTVLGVSCTVMDMTERRDALRKAESARERLALLDDVGVALADLLDVHAVSQALAAALVPRFADYAGVMLAAPLAEGGELPGADAEPVPGTPLMQAGYAARDAGPVVDELFHVTQEAAYLPGTLFGRVLHTGAPLLTTTWEEITEAADPDDPKLDIARELGIHSLLAVPLRARGIVLGVLIISRAKGRDAFGAEDVGLAMELSDRAGISLDNARLYAREREGALMLQRSLLPQRVPEAPGIEVAYRYLPASSGIEVGGDWFDVIPLAGGRVALVVGDVTGHGLRSAVTMGQMRTAVRTLAALDLPPDELLRRINDLADGLAEGGPDGTLVATCLYAVYDPSTRRCALSTAGHVPPLLLTRSGDAPDAGWRARALDLPTGAPLGVGGVPFETTEIDVEDGSVLVLYTDGLVESRGEDITEGLERLRTLLTRAPARHDGPAPRLEGLCDELLADLTSRNGAEAADDVALLMARLGGLPEGSAASWTFAAERYAVRHARRVVRAALHEWGLSALEDTAVLLVSELVTNSQRYAHGPIGVRMVRGSSLLVEVSDPLPDPPRERSVTTDDEGGRGIQLVAREARRWGTRHGPMGKTVWFELALP
nr:SpoIIE family protein phosphatase [Streptomyces sp. HNM0574]